uniref:Uncharacterized protein n=1 Tax=Caenorhabditis tropicalis TaxID=1561998 RepID=A0A1I7TLQ2_9PELO
MSSFPFYTYSLVFLLALLAPPASGIVCLVGNEYHAVIQDGYKYCVTVKDNEINKKIYFGTNDDIDLSSRSCFIEMVETTPLEYCYCPYDHCNHLVRFQYLEFMKRIVRFSFL